MTITAVETYMPQCETCNACIRNLIAWALNDPTLKGLSLVAGTHCHEPVKGRSAGTAAKVQAVAAEESNFDVWTAQPPETPATP